MSQETLPNILIQLQALLGNEQVITDSETLELYSQDIWRAGESIGAVVRPTGKEQLAEIARLSETLGFNLAVRGGGMSYTQGYTQTSVGTIIVCTRLMSTVVEVNRNDMTVTVLAGCTWSTLYETLKKQGLRTPYWGPLSGRYATVGGSVSQNSIFWGGSRYGSAADSIIGMEVVLANGEIMRTGAASQANADPFFRHFGPDLTGLFCCDCGALGLKATITLRLLPDANAKEFLSLNFSNHNDLLAAMSEVSRQDLGSECFGFDPLLTEMRSQRDSLMADAKSLGNVLADTGSLKQAASDTLAILKGGRSFMKNLAWPLHVIVEERNAASATEVAERIRSIVKSNNGTEVPNSIPRIMRANPFGSVNNMIGPCGERWAPVHGLLPLSLAQQATDAVLAIFDSHKTEFDTFGIRTGFLYNSVASYCIAVEPLFFWPDNIDSIHRNSVDADFYRRVPKLDQNLEARTLVASVRQEVADTFSELGASHLQIGRSYHYSDALETPPLRLIEGIKAVLDPDGRINPGVLGLGNRESTDREH